MRVGQDSGIRLKLRQSRVGLGCSRLGSLLEGSDETMLDLLRGAYGVGARVFDTADIYGQGASERILGQFLSSVDREDIVVITKVGQVFPLHLRLLIPFKKFVRFFLTMLSFGKELAGRARQRELGRDFSKPHIVEGLQSSLKRLGVSWVDILLLHSPASSVLRDGAALQTLGWLKSEGRIRLAGVSCDDVETAALAASDPRVDVIQISTIAGEFQFCRGRPPGAGSWSARDCARSPWWGPSSFRAETRSRRSVRAGASHA